MNPLAALALLADSLGDYRGMQDALRPAGHGVHRPPHPGQKRSRCAKLRQAAWRNWYTFVLPRARGEEER